jgi:hypothetical protein
LEKEDLGMAEDVLIEAIDYAKAEKIWKIGTCFKCGEMFLRADSDNKLVNNHLYKYLNAFKLAYKLP